MSRRRFIADRVRPVTIANMHGDSSTDIDDQNHLDKPGSRSWLAENDKPTRGAPSTAAMAEMKRRLNRKGKQ